MSVPIAIFWDFAQLHESLLYSTLGNPSRIPATLPQPEVIDVECLLQFADEAGRVVLNRAYADWRQLGSYAEALTDAPIDLTQVFPTKLGNNTTNRRLVSDVISYLETPDSATDIMIIGGGSEYRQLRKVIHAKGGKLLGVGVEASVDDFWLESCDEFHFYHRLGCRKLYSGNFESINLDIDRARSLLMVAMNQLARYYGTEWIQQVRIKPAIIRQEPEFDESLLGYDAFSHFLRDQSDLLDRRHREGEQEPEYRLLSGGAPVGDVALRPSSDQVAVRYLRVAGQQGIRMPDPVIMWEGIDVYAGFLADGISFASFSEIDQECLRLLREDFPKLSMTEVKKVRQVLFKCFLFRPSVDDTIGFHDEVRDLADIEDRYFQLMLARIGNNIEDPLDYTALSLALTGNPSQADRLEGLEAEEE